jgi:hypothetical protein
MRLDQQYSSFISELKIALKVGKDIPARDKSFLRAGSVISGLIGKPNQQFTVGDYDGLSDSF